jgi:hypothetical protein
MLLKIKRLQYITVYVWYISVEGPLVLVLVQNLVLVLALIWVLVLVLVLSTV